VSKHSNIKSVKTDSLSLKYYKGQLRRLRAGTHWPATLPMCGFSKRTKNSVNLGGLPLAYLHSIILYTLKKGVKNMTKRVKRNRVRITQIARARAAFGNAIAINAAKVSIVKRRRRHTS
jgi:hypothetical protein